MTHVENVRAYLRAIEGLPIERQRELCAAIAGATYYEGDERDAWVRALRRDEMALVARLEVIAQPKTIGSRRPLVDFTATLADLLRKARVVVDAETGITSEDGRRWRDLVEWTAHRIATGKRRLPRKMAKTMAQKRWAAAEPGVVERWKSPAKTKDRERWGQHYRDPSFSSARVAFEAMPEEIRAEIGSLKTAERIFGRRRPGDPSAGGRRPKRRGKR